jgi:osmotically-inducible protein OsmY
MQRLGINDAALARREITRNDAAHNKAMQSMLGIDWTEAPLYALVLNTSRVPVQDCVEHIVRVAASAAFEETAESRAALLDALILSRVRTALDQRFGSGATLAGIDATVSSGKVSLLGATSDERLIVEAVRLVHAVEGVKGIESKIAHIAFRPST